MDFCASTMPENNNVVKKPPTDFTIDCILAKSDTQRQKSPLTHYPLNRVPDNPWISKCPLNLTFKPSLVKKAKSATTSPTSPCSFNLYTLAKSVPSFDGKATSSRTPTSARSGFHPVATSTSSNAAGSSEKLHSALKVFTSKPCDQSRISPSDDGEKSIPSPSSFPSFFDKSELLEVCKNLTCDEKNRLISVVSCQAQEKFQLKQKYECSECNKKFSQLRNFKYHMSIHRGTKEFAANCPECGKTFNDKGYLSSHMKIHR